MIFSLVTFGSYGIFIVLELFYRNGFRLDFGRSNYILEIVSILVQIIVFPRLVFYFRSGTWERSRVINLYWYLLGVLKSGRVETRNE